MPKTQKSTPIKKGQERLEGHSRGRTTHDKCVEAALRLLSRHGTTGVTHRSVATEAGVSIAVTTYHFESRDEILEKAYHLLYEQEVARWRQANKMSKDEIVAPEDIIDRISTQLIRETTEFKEQTMASFQLTFEAFRSQNMSDAIKDVNQVRIAYWKRTVANVGTDDAALDGQVMFCSALGKTLGLMARGKLDSELSRTRSKIEYDFHSMFPNAFTE